MSEQSECKTNKDSNKDIWNPDVNQDEAILAQEKRIERDIADSIKLISEKTSLNCLLLEYPIDDKVYQNKIKDLMSRFDLLRRTRPDGNCFFRGFTFAYFEYLLQDEDELDRFIKVSQQSKDDLIKLGFPKFTVEDISESFLNALTMIKSKEVSTVRGLTDLFNDQPISDYLVVFMRLLTSGHLQKDSDFYSNFIDGSMSIKEFCNHEVEPMYKESDHIHIIALTSAIGVGVSINYLDRFPCDKVTVHQFPEGCEAKIHLLYRPGHYDILYPKSEN